MFPIRDVIKSRRKPIINNLIIILNILIFLYQFSLTKKDYVTLVYTYGLIPLRVSRQITSFNFTSNVWLNFIYSMFLHGGWLHLIGNMWFLYIFGDNVEDSMGHFKYLIFYILGGILAGFIHFIINPTSNVPTIGASGAISAVMGAYIILYPKSKIVTFVPLFGILPLFINIPAFIYLLLWFLGQFQFGNAASGGVAWGAHIGGFIAGMFLQKLFINRRTYNEWS